MELTPEQREHAIKHLSKIYVLAEVAPVDVREFLRAIDGVATLMGIPKSEYAERMYRDFLAAMARKEKQR